MNCPKMFFYVFNSLILSQRRECNFMIYGEDEICNAHLCYLQIFVTFRCNQTMVASITYPIFSLYHFFGESNFQSMHVSFIHNVILFSCITTQLWAWPCPQNQEFKKFSYWNHMLKSINQFNDKNRKI
jgi:hypothetical protein